MREILFRGKQIPTGVWIFGDLNHDDDYVCIFNEDGLDSYENYVVDPATIGQYTGLTDKNGKKIFEGDILLVVDNNMVEPTPFSIIWNDNHAGWFWKDTNTDCFWYSIAKTSEVIGNIHDNPELLEAEQ